LLTEKPVTGFSLEAQDYAKLPWLIRRHAITVLPSVASLKAIRQFARASKATEPFIGFGNPLLLGPNGDDRRAWARQSCAAPAVGARIAPRAPRGSLPKFFRNGLGNVEEILSQYPLPETSDELCAVARTTGASDAAVYLGDKATERVVKAMSADGTLAKAKVVHFATHGLLAGESKMLGLNNAEPALILTPPDKPTESDDGLLTASEVAQLKLDANWVVLSACNTAGGQGGQAGSEAFSGLARAFFYAGTRSLLVSHWAVNSEATVKLVGRTFAELNSRPDVGRAEALRLAMLSLINDGYAHPAYWSPFVVVGEGR
jgi:CHAT domain-containing protein